MTLDRDNALQVLAHLEQRQQAWVHRVSINFDEREEFTTHRWRDGHVVRERNRDPIVRVELEVDTIGPLSDAMYLSFDDRHHAIAHEFALRLMRAEIPIAKVTRVDLTPSDAELAERLMLYWAERAKL